MEWLHEREHPSSQRRHLLNCAEPLEVSQVRRVNRPHCNYYNPKSSKRGKKSWFPVRDSCAGTAVGALPSAEQLEQLEQLGVPPGWRAKLGA